MAKVLIVEDEFMIAAAVKRGLERAGMECVIAGDGNSAIEHARSFLPHVVLLDVCLPGDMDGIEAAVEIRKFVDCKFVVMTGNRTCDIQDRAALIEPIEVLAKPYSLLALIELLQSAIGQ